MRRKKLITSIVLVLLLASAFSSSAVFAAMPPDDTIDPQSIVMCTSSFIAQSSTKAKAEIYATNSGSTPYITSKVTLQSASLGSTNFSDVSGVDPVVYTVENQSYISHKCYFTITSNKEYRIKIELTDKVNGIITTKTYYESLER